MIWAFVVRHWKAFLMGTILLSGLCWGAIQTHRVGLYQSDLKVAEKALGEAQAEIAILNTIRVADEKADEVRTVYIEKHSKELDKKHEETVKALEANPDWANSPVPPAVLDSLR